MKRDPRFYALSSEHHHALVLARRATSGEVDVVEARRRYDEDLAPHFAIEEVVLLPALRSAGETELAARTEREHAAIRTAIADGDLATFGALLTAHVRFEERELFPACEERLSDGILDTLAVHRLR